MGTRADYYVGRGEKAQWLGSTAWDGYPEGIDQEVLQATTKNDFIDALMKFFETRNDVSGPDHGWPWPWEDSNTTDYTYAFDDGKVWASCFGSNWFDPLVEQPRTEEGDRLDLPGSVEAVFPNMKEFQNIAWDNRSGVMLIQDGKIVN